MKRLFLLLSLLVASNSLAAPLLIDYEIQCAVSGPLTLGDTLRLGFHLGPFNEFSMCDAREYVGNPEGTVYVFASIDDNLDENCAAWRNGESFYLAIGFREIMGVVPNLKQDYGQFLTFVTEPLSDQLDFSVTDATTATSVWCRGPALATPVAAKPARRVTRN